MNKISPLFDVFPKSSTLIIIIPFYNYRYTFLLEVTIFFLVYLYFSHHLSSTMHVKIALHNPHLNMSCPKVVRAAKWCDQPEGDPGEAGGHAQTPGEGEESGSRLLTLKIDSNEKWGESERWLWLGLDGIRTEKIPRNRHGTISVIPRKKVLIPRHSEFSGRANSEARNGTERNGIQRKKCSFTEIARPLWLLWHWTGDLTRVKGAW